ncbi:HNH endonuclease signature motif containing protein [Corynebacterium sp. H127]|uniref:HNH endonuclease signature motif containing protein n=1 Tax=Corynebacterium sp. H127 TaxID=3133418 RepID=UPI0030997E01
MIAAAKELLGRALVDGASFDSFSELMDLKEIVARLETEMAHGRERYELEQAGASRPASSRIARRAANVWYPSVPVEHQDVILSALQRLSGASKRRGEIYDLAAQAAPDSSVQQTHEYAKRLVREENQSLAEDPAEAFRQRRFSMRSQDEHGGCSFYGYAPAATAALLKAMVDRAFHAESKEEANECRTVSQRSMDAFDQVLRWASSNRVGATGHCSLVVSVSESDEFDWRARFASNVGIDLSLVDITQLAGDRLTDYIVVHDHHGAVKSLVTGERTASFYQRMGLVARDLVCQFPGCGEPASRCDAHHVLPWARGGGTEIGNLVLVCRRHHRRNDDSWVETHFEMELGRAVLVASDGARTRNKSPGARRAGRFRLEDL